MSDTPKDYIFSDELNKKSIKKIVIGKFCKKEVIYFENLLKNNNYQHVIIRKAYE